jgi:transposase-like protein
MVKLGMMTSSPGARRSTSIATCNAAVPLETAMPHSIIRHTDWYVDADVHTNTIEGFWALLKRGMFGQFHSVSKKHLQRYVDEFCYRYNLRNADKGRAFTQTINLGLGVAA